jgi:hypothetical protein
VKIGSASIASNRQVRGLMLGLMLVALVWGLATQIVAGSDQMLIMFGLSLVFGAQVIYIMVDWRSAVFLFLIWLSFEDLARKYLGNSMAVFFAKDFLIGFAYLSYYLVRRRRKVDTFKIPFLVPLMIFFWFAVIQVFNTWSPNVLYGLLGLKIYFYYAPMMLLGYAMLERPEHLNKFLVVTLVAGIVISLLGIAQAVLGLDFLTPDDIAPELYELTHLVRGSPITHQASSATSSVFVSAGRFSTYLILIWIIAMGTQGYLLLSRRRGAIYGFLGIGVVTVAVLTSGTRTPFVFVSASALMMGAAFLWGAPWRWGQAHRLVTALRRAFFVGAICVILLAEVFPNALGGHWAYLTETLAFKGAGSELQERAWNYPVLALMQAIGDERWAYGHGTGLNSLGKQYVARLLAEPVPNIGVENGFGSLIVEMGILGPVLWMFWVTALLWSGWRVVKQLRQTMYFPIAFAIWWYALVVLVLLFYLSDSAYENYVNNAYLWLLIGILFRLPKLAQIPQPVPLSEGARGMARWQLATGGR